MFPSSANILCVPCLRDTGLDGSTGLYPEKTACATGRDIIADKQNTYAFATEKGNEDERIRGGGPCLYELVSKMKPMISSSIIYPKVSWRSIDGMS